MANIINTRIVLRNDDLSNWVDSTKPLLKGEVALAKRDNGTYDLRIGDGANLWKNLSNSFALSADQVIGLTDSIASLSTSFYEVSNKSDLTGNYNNGDIAIVKTEIGSGTEKYSYTAYRYDSSLTADDKWCALDGNYSAENVYFDSDITLAGSYTSVGNIKISDGTLSAKGKNLETLFNDIFDQTVQPTLGTSPSNSVSLTNAGAYEVGTEITPAYSVTYTQGKYNTPWNNSTINDGTSATAYSVTASNGSTATGKSGSLSKITVGDGTNYTVTSTTSYSAGSVAKDNKGNDSNPIVQRAAGTTAASSKSSAITAFRYWYIGCTTDTAEITETTIKGLTKFRTCDSGKTKSVKASGGNVTLTSGTKRIIVALPSTGYSSYDTLSQVLLVSASNTPITDSYKQQENVNVSGKDGASSIAYKVYVYQPDAIGMDEHHSITVG